jgi:hypothetical protein
MIDMQRTTYRLVRAKTKTQEGTVVCIPPSSPNSNAGDWASLFTELDGLKLGYSWSGGVHDADDPHRIWLVDEYGYMSHCLEPAAANLDVIAKQKDGACPHCGEHGRFVRMALVCSRHGAYAGL